MSKNKLSVVINTLNEENNLSRALSSLGGLADEVVVVDMHSNDRTIDIAKEHKAKVFRHKKTKYVEPARNFAISKATCKWILVLDADEEVPPGLAKEIKRLIKKPKADYYRLPRKNIIFSKWIKHSRWWPDYNIRLFKKGSVTWNEIIHSVPLTTGKGLDLPDKENLAIVHYHYTSVSQYLTRMDRYTTELALNKTKDGYTFQWRDMIKKPVSEFLSRYFFGGGYKDGIHGLVISGLQALSEFILYVKVWEMSKYKDVKIDVKEVIDEIKNVNKEINYWQADTLVKEKGGIVNRIKRKFKLP